MILYVADYIQMFKILQRKVIENNDHIFNKYEKISKK